jgi:hypothetical protein
LAVFDHHAFGAAGRSRRVDGVGEVVGCGVVGWSGVCIGQCVVVGGEQGCVGVVEDERDPFGGVGGVDGYVGGAGFEDAEDGDDELAGAGQADAHQGAGSGAVLAEMVGEAVR